MKSICCLLLLAFVITSHAQQVGVYQLYIDQSVRALDQSTPAQLVKEIITPGQTDRQKVTAIFRWITSNISYNVKAWNRANRHAPVYEEPDDTASTLKPLNLRVAETVLARRVAICDGYAKLFKTLCDHAGVPSEIIYGYGRTGSTRGRDKFKSNHTWNAVYLDSSWHLLDATWAAGFTSVSYRGEEFVREYDNRYFLTKPEQFILDHYPEDLVWTLMKDPPDQSEFNSAPFKYMGYVKTLVNSHSPSKGIIEAAIGDSIRFQVETSSVYGLLSVTSTPPVDTIWNDDEPVIIGGRKKSFTYKVTDPSAQWLYVTCNGRIILRYKLNIIRTENRTAMRASD